MNNEDITNTILQIDKDINELQLQKELVKSIDFSKSVDEDTWHEICKTPLRTSNLLAVLVKNIFPLAENINVHCNYVYFNLIGFKVQIPTSAARGINVDTSWYRVDNGEPKMYLTDAQQSIKKYFEELDNGANWWTLANIRLNYKKWFIPFAWWFRYKWKNPHRKEWEKLLEEKEQNLIKQKAQYYTERNEMRIKTLKLRDELLPMINTFSEQHYVYNNNWGKSIAEVISAELNQQKNESEDL